MCPLYSIMRIQRIIKYLRVRAQTHTLTNLRLLLTNQRAAFVKQSSSLSPSITITQAKVLRACAHAFVYTRSLKVQK